MSSSIIENNLKLSVPLTLFHCGLEKCKPSHSFGPAIRPHYLFHFITNGTGKYFVNNKIYSLKKGQGFLILPGYTTFYIADEKDPWEYCWIGFDGYDTKTILKQCGFDNQNLIYDDSSNSALEKSLKKLTKTFEQGKGNEYTILGQLYLCFSHMYQESFDVNPKLHSETHLEKALNYIHNNFIYDIQIADVANHVGIDRTYLYKIFMNHKNTSPLQYLIDYRLSVAKKLLIETNYSVTEIIYSCGFQDTPTFYKHFKKRLSITPLEYRKQHR